MPIVKIYPKEVYWDSDRPEYYSLVFKDGIEVIVKAISSPDVVKANLGGQ